MTEGYTKKWFARCVCAVLVTGGTAGCSVSIDAPPPGDAPYAFTDDDDPALAALPFVETELLAQPLPGVEEADLQALFAEVGAEVVERLDEIQLVVLLVPQGRLSEVAGALDASGLIDTLQKNYILEAQRVPDDPLYGLQPYLAQVRAPQAWDVTVSASNVIIASGNPLFGGDRFEAASLRWKSVRISALDHPHRRHGRRRRSPRSLREDHRRAQHPRRQRPL